MKERYKIFQWDGSRDPISFKEINGGYAYLNDAIRECSLLNKEYENGTMVHVVIDEMSDNKEILRCGSIKND